MAINNENELLAACNSRIAMVLTKQSSLLGLIVFEILRDIYIVCPRYPYMLSLPTL